MTMDRIERMAGKVAGNVGSYAKVVELSATKDGFDLMVGYAMGRGPVPADAVKYALDDRSRQAVKWASMVERKVPARTKGGIGESMVVAEPGDGLVIKTWLRMDWTDGGAWFGTFAKARACELEISRLAGLHE